MLFKSCKCKTRLARWIDMFFRGVDTSQNNFLKNAMYFNGPHPFEMFSMWCGACFVVVLWENSNIASKYFRFQVFSLSTNLTNKRGKSRIKQSRLNKSGFNCFYSL